MIGHIQPILRLSQRVVLLFPSFEHPNRVLGIHLNHPHQASPFLMSFRHRQLYLSLVDDFSDLELLGTVPSPARSTLQIGV